MTNLELVKEHNVQHALKQKTYSLAMNHLADLVNLIFIFEVVGYCR